MYEFLSTFSEDKNPATSHGSTPLYVTAQEGHLDLCKFILEKVTDKNPRDSEGRTPLHIAAYNGHLNIFKLIEKEVVLKNPITTLQSRNLRL